MGTILYGTFVGWLTHWALHQPWSGKFQRAHMNHHLKQYPPKDLRSKTYRSAGTDDALFAFIPTIGGAILLWSFFLKLLGVSWSGIGLVFLESLLVGWFHQYFHEGFHVENFWLRKYRWFQKLEDLHYLHHRNMRRNLGILWFGWDRVFRTYREVVPTPSEKSNDQAR